MLNACNASYEDIESLVINLCPFRRCFVRAERTLFRVGDVNLERIGLVKEWALDQATAQENEGGKKWKIGFSY